MQKNCSEQVFPLLLHLCEMTGRMDVKSELFLVPQCLECPGGAFELYWARVQLPHAIYFGASSSVYLITLIFSFPLYKWNARHPLWYCLSLGWAEPHNYPNSGKVCTCTCSAISNYYHDFFVLILNRCNFTEFLYRPTSDPWIYNFEKQTSSQL